MNVLGWWRERQRQAEPDGAAAWRAHWATAVEMEDAGAIEPLRTSLLTLAAAVEDVEIEQEMLDGLTALVGLAASLRDGHLPRVVTGHRVVGSDACAFSAPCSLPDDPAQPAGRLILTDRRAIFAGGGQSISIPWHRVGAVLRIDRDLLLAPGRADTAHRFRCNSYADTLCAAAIARHLGPGIQRSRGL